MISKYIVGKDRPIIILMAVFSILITSLDLQAREINPKLNRIDKSQPYQLSSSNDPIVYYAAHTRGNMQLAVANNGTFGSYGSTIIDPITGQQIQSCIYPKNSDIVSVWVGALWIGAIVGRDTLVSTGTEDFYELSEFWPNPGDSFQFQTIDENSPFYSDDARSEEDIVCTYTDTFTNSNLTGIDQFDGNVHKPLNIKVFQRSMAWSYEYADDFILFDYQIENIGTEVLNNVYMGIYIDGDVWHKANQGPQGWDDDIVGFIHDFDAPEGHGFKDTVNIAYNADNNGDPTNGQWDEKSCTSVIGTKVVRTPADSLDYSFNWWIIDYGDARLDFGPRKLGTTNDPYRDFGARIGTPMGDKNKYYVLKHKEFDYDLLFTALDHTEEGYLPPPEKAANYADGYDCRYLLSFGPFNISPGEKLPITFAWVGGEHLHTNPDAFNSFDPFNPYPYYNQLNFSELAVNSRWASWVYDNPGVDTDGDGYRGKYRVINYDSTLTYDTVSIDPIIIDTSYVYNVADTIYYEGDGVPDFKGASPPPAPEYWVYPEVGKIKIRFNGLRSETAKDQFSGEQDFEGYRVYIGRDNLKSSYSLVSSYDRENYNKYVYNYNKLPEPGFELLEAPFTIGDLRCLYGDSCGDVTFDPGLYPRSNPYVMPGFPDSIFYFDPQDFNASTFGVDTDIRKIYPDQPYPSSLDPDSVQTDELTEDGHLKYFEYEITIDNLLPSILYWVNVTAFDYGSPEVGLRSLESSVVNNAKSSYALYSLDNNNQQNYENIYTYPNPYRLDGNYRKGGFEGRDRRSMPDNRVRALHFVNIPPKCTIKILSLDGDLIKEIDHDKDPGDPLSGHEEWDLVTRNTQEIVSGLYYYVVEWDSGSFIGKFVILM